MVGGEVREGRSGDTPTRVSALGGGTSEEGVTGGRERERQRERRIRKRGANRVKEDEAGDGRERKKQAKDGPGAVCWIERDVTTGKRSRAW